jgi:hypothetical protein
MACPLAQSGSGLPFGALETSLSFMEKAIKTVAILAIAAGFLALTSTASTDKYGDLVAKGFRWSRVHGLYACVSKDDVPLMLNNPSDKLLLKMVEQVKAYFLTTGALVQATEEDPHLGLSKIRVPGITVELWTSTKFLSSYPIKDICGVVETPETSGLIPAAAIGVNAGPTPLGEFNPSPTRGTSAVPGPSPIPGVGPLEGTSPTPAGSPSPTPGENPSPTPD